MSTFDDILKEAYLTLTPIKEEEEKEKAGDGKLGPKEAEMVGHMADKGDHEAENIADDLEDKAKKVKDDAAKAAKDE